MASEKKSNAWVTDLLVAFAATTLSIILTFGTTLAVNRHTQKKERKLTAMMVMGSVESFARTFEEAEGRLAHIDSVATWLLGLPVDDVARLGDKPFAEAFRDVFDLPTIVHDKTAETIFSANIDTGKNMGIFPVIDNAGACFSAMDWMEEYYNDFVRTYRSTQEGIFSHPNDYPGRSLAEKYLRSEQLRRQMRMPNAVRNWLSYSAESLRERNRINMHLIGIGESYEQQELNMSDFAKPVPDRDSLAVHLNYARQVDSLLAGGAH